MPSRLSAGAVLGIAALAVFTVWITWRAKSLERGSVRGDRTVVLKGKPAPDFTLESLGGGTVSLAAFRGKKKVLVSFWASWCGPCRMELPVLRKLYQNHHKADSDFEFLAVSVDEDRASAQSAANANKLPFPVLLDPAHKTADAYGVQGIPTLFIVDKSGKVIYGEVGFGPALEVMVETSLNLKKEAAAKGELDGDAGH